MQHRSDQIIKKKKKNKTEKEKKHTVQMLNLHVKETRKVIQLTFHHLLLVLDPQAEEEMLMLSPPCENRGTVLLLSWFNWEQAGVYANER